MSSLTDLLLAARSKINADSIFKAKIQYKIAKETLANSQKDREIVALTDLLLYSKHQLENALLDKAKLSILVAENQKDKQEMQRMLDASEGGEI